MVKKSNEYGVKTDLHGRTLRVTTKPKPRMRAKMSRELENIEKSLRRVLQDGRYAPCHMNRLRGSQVCSLDSYSKLDIINVIRAEGKESTVKLIREIPHKYAKRLACKLIQMQSN